MLTGTNIARAISLARQVTSNAQQQALIVARLQVLDNAWFNYLYTNISNERMYLGQIDTLGYFNVPVVGQMVNIRIRYTDILSGEIGDPILATVRGAIMQAGQFAQVLQSVSQNNWSLKKQFNNDFFFTNPALGGYNLPGTQPTVIGTPGSGSGSGGTITPGTGTIEPGTKPQPTNLDIESLLMPAAIALGLYFILKK